MTRDKKALPPFKKRIPSRPMGHGWTQHQARWYTKPFVGGVDFDRRAGGWMAFPRETIPEAGGNQLGPYDGPAQAIRAVELLMALHAIEVRLWVGAAPEAPLSPAAFSALLATLRPKLDKTA